MAGDAPDAIERAVEESPDLCILDVRMPGGGVAAAWEISSRLPEAKIVMLTVSSDDGDLFASLRAGASGYLLKDMDPAQLPNVLSDVLNGEAALPPALVARVIGEFRDRSPRRRAVLPKSGYETLTSREWQVLELLRQELSTAAIARRLVVSPVDGPDTREQHPPQGAGTEPRGVAQGLRRPRVSLASDEASHRLKRTLGSCRPRRFLPELSAGRQDDRAVSTEGDSSPAGNM